MRKKILLSVLISLTFALPALADKKIAVLPLITSNNKEEIKQFSFGTMASISHALKSISGYTVVDRGQIESLIKEIGLQNSGLTDKKDNVKIGKISGVNIIVSGTIQEANGNYRININFTDVQTNNIIKTFQVTGKDIFELQDKLSAEILKDTDITVKSLMETSNSAAYNYYVEAKELSAEFNTLNLDKSLNLLNKSIKKDPSYISAKALRSKVNAMLALILKNSGAVYLDKFSNAEVEAQTLLEEESKNILAYDALYIIYEIEGKRDNLSEIANNYAKTSNVEYSDLNGLLGKFYYNANKLDDAEYFLSKSIKANNKNIYSYYLLANTYRNKGENDKPEKIYLDALKSDPESPYIKYALAGEYYFSSNYEKAIPLYLDIIKTDTEDDFVYSGLGDSYLALEKNDEAIKAYQKAIEKNPKESYHYNRLGDLYFKIDKLEESEKQFTEALKINKNVDSKMTGWYLENATSSMSGLALVYEKKGKKEEALNNLMNALKINPNSSTTQFKALGFYKRNKMYKEAVKLIDEQIKQKRLKKNYPISQETVDLTQLSDGYKELSDYDNAIRNIKVALDKEKVQDRRNYISSKLKDYYLLYGINKYKEAKYAEAIEMYKNALEISYSKELEISQNVNIYNNLGIAYYMIKNYEKSIEMYKKSLELKPDHTDSISNLGMTYEATGKKAEALLEYKKACDLGIKDKCGIK